MPQMANITIKASNGTTDVVYVAMAPSSGDTTKAIWRVEAADTAPAFRPVLSMQTRDNGAGDARRADIALDYPIVQTIGGQKQKVATLPFRVTGALPKITDDSLSKEAINDLGKLIASALIQAALQSGYAPS